MSRNLLAVGASALAISLVCATYANAQQSLPTIEVGGARRSAKPAQRASATPGRSAPASGPAAPSTSVASNSGNGQGGDGASTGPDRYAEPKPAPFSRTLPANIPAVVVSRTRAEINNSVNFVTMADAFKYLPSLYIRERFSGDTNAIVSTRTTGLLESANTMVYADNVLLSNYLGSGFAYPPRWGMVAPEEIERVDVVYGPFSALYPGNSVGGVLTMTTRMPERLEVHARGLGAAQTYNQYSYSSTPLTGNVNVLVGDKFGDRFRVFVNYNHLDSTSQPLQYSGNAILPTNTAGFGSGSSPGSWSNSNTQGPQFSGGNYVTNVYGFPAVITGANSITHTVQDLGKVKMSFDLTDDTRVYVQSAFWNNTQSSNVASFIADRNGVPIFNTQGGDVQFWGPIQNYTRGSGANATYGSAPGGFSVTPGGNNPGQAESQHTMNTLQLKRDSGKELDFDLSLSQYNYLRDFSNTANAYGLLPNNSLTYSPPGAANNFYSRWSGVGGQICNSPTARGPQTRWSVDCGASPYPYLANPTGLNTVNDGNYWRTGDARFIYRPNVDIFGKHEISFGGHSDKYSLNTVQYQTLNFPSNYYFGISQKNTGQTNMNGAYIQDAWKINDRLKFIGGLRNDWWQAYNGQNTTGSMSISNNQASGYVQNPSTFAVSNPGAPPFVNITAANATRNTVFPSVNKSGFQPKAALEYKVMPNWEVRGSMGRAYRFPTVAEMFQSLTTPNSATVNNPSLQPQSSTSWDFTQSWRFVDSFGGVIGLINPRVSLFREDRWNAIIAQSTINSLGLATTQQINVNRARIQGVEGELVLRDAFIEGLGFSGSITFTDAKILNNNTPIAGNQAVPLVPTWGNRAPFLNNLYPNYGVGGALVNYNQYPGIPPLRLKSVISYSPTKNLDFAFMARYQSAAFQTINNIDWNHDASFGSYSTQLIFDTKVNYRFEKHWTANFGVNNIGNWVSWVGPHPNPQRMFFAGLNYDFGGPEDSLRAGSQNPTQAWQN